MQGAKRARARWRWVIIGWLLTLGGVAAVVAPANSLANGGAIIFSSDTGSFNVQLAISPTPPVPTVPAHFTMIITKKSSDVPVADATVFVEPTMPGMAMPGVDKVRLVQNQGRPNQYDADVPVSMEGQWNFQFTVVSPSQGQTTFTASAKVEKADAPWPLIIAILVALPALAGLTWWFLFRNSDKDEDDEDEGQDQRKNKPEVKVG